MPRRPRPRRRTPLARQGFVAASGEPHADRRQLRSPRGCAREAWRLQSPRQRRCHDDGSSGAHHPRDARGADRRAPTPARSPPSPPPPQHCQPPPPDAPPAPPRHRGGDDACAPPRHASACERAPAPPSRPPRSRPAPVSRSRKRPTAPAGSRSRSRVRPGNASKRTVGPPIVAAGHARTGNPPAALCPGPVHLYHLRHLSRRRSRGHPCASSTPGAAGPITPPPLMRRTPLLRRRHARRDGERPLRAGHHAAGGGE
jgi:hypothetical protein